MKTLKKKKNTVCRKVLKLLETLSLKEKPKQPILT